MAAFHLIIYGRFWVITEGWGLLRQRKAIAGRTLRMLGPGIVHAPRFKPEQWNNPRHYWLKPHF
jgi:hypothetical protein